MVSSRRLRNAQNRVAKAVEGKIYTSKKAMWADIHAATAKEYGKLGFKITFKKQKVKRKKLVTQKIGEEW